MIQRSVLPIFVLGLGALAAFGCGDSDDGNGGGTGATGTGASSGLVGIGGQVVNVGGGNSGGSSGTGTFDGGSVPITPEEEDAIRDKACTGWTIEGEVVPSVLELVVDVSGSMDDEAPNSNRTKWEITQEALLDAIVGVNGPGLPATVAIGLLFYPNREAEINDSPANVDQCVEIDENIPIDLLGGPGAAHRELLRERLEELEPGSGTPTHDAYRYALNTSLLPATFPGNKFMLLITDGTPTLSLGCVNESGNFEDVNPQPIVDEITLARSQGIRTFLIGSPGSEDNRTWMSTAAVIGETARPGCNVNGAPYCHMDMTSAPDFSAALRQGLADIAGEIAPCTYTFPDPPAGQTIDPNRINLIVKSGTQASLIVRDDIGDCGEGWQLNSNNEVVLCPTTCAAVQQDPNMNVELSFGCATVAQPPIR